MKTRISYSLALIIGALLAPNASADLALVENGKARATIVLGANASETARQAASELQTYVERISGARLEIRNEYEAVSGPRIFIGSGEAVKAEGLDVPSGFTSRMKEEGYVIRTMGRDLVLAGNEEDPYRGTLFAVYDLLEGLGCRWFFPGPFGEVIPKLDTITVKDVNRIERPDFRFRNIWYSGWMPVRPEDSKNFAQWMDRNRMTSLSGLSLPGDGSITRLAPAEQYFESHPQIYAMDEKGGRMKDMLCMSEPQAVQIAVKTITDEFRARPDALTFGFAPPDGHPRCFCDRCSAAIPGFTGKGFGEPSLSDLWFRFANEIAKEVYREFPDRWLFTNGYANRVRPPEGIGELSPNLGIQSAMIDTCTFHRIGDPECWQRQVYQTILDRWTGDLNCVFIYDYDPGKSLDNLPFPMLHNLGPDFRYFQERGVWGFWTEGHNAWMCTHLNYYARAKLMWNVDTDLQALVRDYCEKFYGKAAKPIERYIWTLEKAVENAEVHTTWGRLVPWRVIITPQVLGRLDRFVRRAHQLGQNETETNRLHLRAFALVHDHLAAFLTMEENAAEGDFAGAVAQADRMAALRDQLAEIDPALLPHTPDWCKDHRGTLEWFRKTYQGLADQTGGGKGDLVAMFPRVWEFKTDPEDLGVIEQWYLGGKSAEESNSAPTGWNSIDGTLYWEIQGYQDKRGWSRAARAWYCNQAVVPNDAQGPLRLTIGGVYSSKLWIWINGMLVAHRAGQDSASPFDLDVTSHIRPGQANRIAILVNTISADRNPRGGLHRRVFLWRPKD